MPKEERKTFILKVDDIKNNETLCSKMTATPALSTAYLNAERKRKMLFFGTFSLSKKLLQVFRAS